MSKTAAIIGGGVIGGGWAARFLLNGWDVRVFDPDPKVKRKIGEVLANARHALPSLSDRVMPREGRLSYHDTIAEAVSGASYIQESVPERLDIKHTTFAAINAVAPNAIVGSSTSGFKPSQLAQGAKNATQIMVCHPFNPVYLLPVIEVVPSPATSPASLNAAKEILKSVGMKPIHVRREIDAHVADRLLEAVWREALWLIKDDIATTEEIDDIIRYGFGLRWAQMGLFETYRIAGGEAGMAHFIKQFGPALAWPWTKLMDVPELDDALVKKIADQSDAQSGMYSIRELERIRDTNLVMILRGLKTQNWGAGAILNNVDSAAKDTDPAPDLKGLVRTMHRNVPLDWIDYNGHMTESRYLHAFGDATDRFMEIIGCDGEYIASGGSYFTAETHIRHLDEVHAGAEFTIDTQCLMGGGKKMHIFHRMRHIDGRLLATGEHMLLHVSLETRQSCPPAPHIEAKLAEIARNHANMPMPEGAGRAIGQGR